MEDRTYENTRIMSDAEEGPFYLTGKTGGKTGYDLTILKTYDDLTNKDGDISSTGYAAQSSNPRYLFSITGNGFDGSKSYREVIRSEDLESSEKFTEALEIACSRMEEKTNTSCNQIRKGLDVFLEKSD